MKQFENSPFLGEPSTYNYPPIFEQYFHDTHLCPNFKNENPSSPALVLGLDEVLKRAFLNFLFTVVLY